MNTVQLKEELFVQCKCPIVKCFIIQKCLELSINRPSSDSPQQSISPGGCVLSNCFACYYSYNALPFPEEAKSCPTDCPLIREELDENCMKFWGQCVRRVYSKLYYQVKKGLLRTIF